MLSYISKSRASLMVLAMLGVLFTHSGLRCGVYFLDYWIQWGYGGVDLFFFLSGFGLYYSCTKDSRCLPFWGKRLKRIMPPLVACIIVEQLIFNHAINFELLVKKALLVGFWIPQLRWPYFAWFVSGIMLLYLVFPFFFRFFKRSPLASTLVASAVGVSCAAYYSYYFFVLHPGTYNGLILFLARVPVFFAGVYTGHLAQREKAGSFTLSKGGVAAVLLMGVVGYGLLRYVGTLSGWDYIDQRNSGGIFYPFLLIVPGFALTFGYLLSLLPQMLQRAASFVGSATLETYLLIGTVFFFKPRFVQLAWGNPIAGSLLMMAACIATGMAVHYLVVPAFWWLWAKTALLCRGGKSRGRSRR